MMVEGTFSLDAAHMCSIRGSLFTLPLAVTGTFCDCGTFWTSPFFLFYIPDVLYLYVRNDCLI